MSLSPNTRAGISLAVKKSSHKTTQTSQGEKNLGAFLLSKTVLTGLSVQTGLSFSLVTPLVTPHTCIQLPFFHPFHSRSAFFGAQTVICRQYTQHPIYT